MADGTLLFRRIQIGATEMRVRVTTKTAEAGKQTTRPKRNNERKTVARCYDHLGGKLGEALLRFLLDQQWVEKSKRGRDYQIAEKGWKELERFGIDPERLRSTKRKIVTSCTERKGLIHYEHTGAYLGALLAERLFELGWLVERNQKEHVVTKAGARKLKSLGILSSQVKAHALSPLTHRCTPGCPTTGLVDVISSW